MQATGRRAGVRRLAVAAIATGALVLGLAPATTPASAASFSGGARAVSVTSTSMTVAPSTSWAPGRYRILASTNRADLSLSRLKRATASRSTTQEVVTLSGLRYTTAPYYYRVKAKRGKRVTYSSIRSVYLRPPTPSLRVVTSNVSGLALIWSGPAATRYVVIQADDPTMTEGRRAISLPAQLREYTPLGLEPGRQYWFAVQAYNSTTPSLLSPVVTAVPTSAGLDIRAMTYNVMRAKRDGTVVSGNLVAPWSTRKHLVASLIRSEDPDVIALQEASDWSSGSKGDPRQVDSLREALGSSTYALARTEVPPTEAHYFRTGRYILYKSSVFRAVGEGGAWDLGEPFVAYQILEHLQTGTRILALSVHLESGISHTLDIRRQAQTKLLLEKVRTYLAGRPMPVLYMGDYNSHERSKHVIDGPGTVLRPAHMVDSDEVAPVTVNRTLNSANQFLRVAPRYSAHVDHIYVPPGVGVRRFEVVASLTGGRYVGNIPSDHNPVVADLVVPYPSS